MRKIARTSALSAFFVAAITALSACGGGGDSIPGNAVAKVGGESVKKSTFDHWMLVAAKSSAQQTGADPAKVSVPDAPEFVKCAAEKKKTAPKPAKGQPTPTAAQFTQQCKSEYEQYRNSVMSFLISAGWITGESKDQDVSMSDAEVKKNFEDLKKAQFPKGSPTTYEQFLKQTGMTEEDVLFRVRVDGLSEKIRTKIVKDKDKVSNVQISNYYNKNKSRFAAPQRRDLRIVLTKTEAKAKEAKKALEDGGSWKKIAKKYSIDQASKSQGGVLLAVAKGQQEKALDTAVFSADVNKLGGPVKTQFGYYVFEVTKITPATQQTLQQATPTIKQLLQSQYQQDALNKFVKDFQKRWTEKTNCRTDYVITNCKNAPKPKTQTAGATTPATTTTG